MNEQENSRLARMVVASLRERLSITLAGASDEQLISGILNGLKHFGDLDTISEQVENAINPNHPHGPPDPRWITDEGRCLLCAYSYHEGEIKRLTEKCESLLVRGNKAIDQVRELDALHQTVSKERDQLKALLIDAVKSAMSHERQTP